LGTPSIDGASTESSETPETIRESQKEIDEIGRGKTIHEVQLEE
jgi:hypothetical protein